MFFNITYLRKNGRFGLVWLGATRSKVLSKREVISVNIRGVCVDILEHVPGHAGDGGDAVYKRKKRFSLYLSSQLLYGSVKIHQKQSEYLLADVWTLFKMCCPEISRPSDIDLILFKHDPVTIESLMPVNVKDKNYDIFFGSYKEPLDDIETLLEQWDNKYSGDELAQLRSPIRERVSMQPDPNSPHSVSSLKEISIQEVSVQEAAQANTSLQAMEEDLPVMDARNLMWLCEFDPDKEVPGLDALQVEGEAQAAVQQISSNKSADVLMTEIPYPDETVRNQSRLPIIEDTPAVDHAAAEPGTPRKTKKPSRHPDSPRRGKRRRIDQNIPEDQQLQSVQDGAGQERASQDNLELVSGHEIIDRQHQQEDQQIPEQQQQLEPPAGAQPEGYKLKWTEQNLPIHLEQVTPSPSPIRKRRPHKLIIDDAMQFTQAHLKHNIVNSKSTCEEMSYPTKAQKNLFKEPARAFLTPQLNNFWRKYCQFGLRIFDSESEMNSSIGSSIILDPDFEERKKRKSVSDNVPEQSAKGLSEQESIERGRRVSSRTSSLGLEHSHSHVESRLEKSYDQSLQSPQQQAANVSNTSFERPSMEVSTNQVMEVLPVLLEQREHVSPVATEVPVTVPAQGPVPELTLQDAQPDVIDINRLMKDNMRRLDDWTTFSQLCPPASTTRQYAASVFQTLLGKVADKSVHVRQDEPYGEIFLWFPDSLP